jgi:hypothetical protein
MLHQRRPGEERIGARRGRGKSQPGEEEEEEEEWMGCRALPIPRDRGVG